MGRYTGPKGRINRRLGTNVYESSGSIKALERKEYPPGMHRRRKKPTNYGIGLAEKQKIKFFNKKYKTLNTPQKNLLKEYINNISNTNSLREFINDEVSKIKKALKSQLPKVDDDSFAI